LRVSFRGRKPPAEKWVFLSHRLNFRVGGENINKLMLCPINGVK